MTMEMQVSNSNGFTGEMAIMGSEGDTKIYWSKGNVDEVDNARVSFQRLVKDKKYLAFSVRKNGSRGSQITEFDPNAERILFVPPMVGG